MTTIFQPNPFANAYSNLNTINTTITTSMFPVVNSNVDYSLNEVKHTIKHDALLLACTLKRLKDTIPEKELHKMVEKPPSCLLLSLDGSFIASHITDEDRDLADKIRNHYGQKFIVSTLMEENLSDFRKKAQKVLVENANYNEAGSYVYPESLLKVAYKLPYFYEYDLSMVTLFEDANPASQRSKFDHDRMSLTFITKLDANKKRRGVYEYWFKNEHNHRVVLEIDKKNPLLPLWENHININTIDVEANFTYEKKDLKEYYNGCSWNWNLK